jgi:cell division protein FtsW
MASKSAHLLIISVIFLVTLGVVMLSSTSAFSTDAYSDGADLYYDVKRQFVWMGVGIVACFFFAVLDYHWLERLAKPGLIFAAILLALCFVPAFGEGANGAYRWISCKALGLGVLRVQPSELAKIAVIVFLSAWYCKYQSQREQFAAGFALPLLFVIGIVALVAVEVDLGSAALITFVGFMVMFAAGCRLRYLGAMALGGLACAAGLFVALQNSITVQNRMARIIAFTDIEKYKDGLGYQQYRALLAFGSGGLEGLGLGQGRQKMLYLPFAHTDFIFPMVGEELGLRFTLAVVFSFVVIAIAGLTISANAPDRFGKLVGLGLVAMLVSQVVINIGVATSLLPNKGLPLPFVSYGGSNLVCCMIAVGVLLNIYRQGIVAPERHLATILRAKVTPRL